MTKLRQTPIRPRDLNQLAKRVVAISIGEDADESPRPVSPKAAKRGEARAAKLTPEQRKKIAQKAARARWRKER